jgi:hypothetical protein
MKLSYVHSASMRQPAANTLQVARMCEAFAHRGAEVTLHYPRYVAGDVLGRDWRRHYGVDDSFTARPLATLLTPGVARLPGFRPAAKSLAYALLAARGGWRSGDLLFTRCFAAATVFPRLLRLLPPQRRPRVVFESHELPSDRRRAAALRRVDGIVSISRALADDLTRRIGIAAEKILVAHDGVPATPAGCTPARCSCCTASPRPWPGAPKCWRWDRALGTGRTRLRQWSLCTPRPRHCAW